MRHELAPVQRGQAFDNRSDKMRVVFEIPRQGLLHEVIGAAALARSEFSEPGFLFGGEGDFHQTQASRVVSKVNLTAMKSPASADSAGIKGTFVRTGSFDGGLRPIAVWLLCCCGMIFVMVVIGGVTRLTLSGLSITEWEPVVGILPPLSPTAWAAEFAKYQHIPQYRLITYGMSLDEFKAIYLWEYTHRLWGRLIGLYMVLSGLAERVEVSQYRLVAHLALALLIYATTLWVALGILESPSPALREREGPGAKRWEGEGAGNPLAARPLTPALSPGGGEGVLFEAGLGWRRAAEAILGLVALTILAGGFVAGLHAGLTYNTFPLMDGSLVPAGYARLEPFLRNWFENIAAVQFDHRLLATTTTVAVVVLWLAGRRAVPQAAKRALDVLLTVAALQFALGISTLLL